MFQVLEKYNIFGDGMQMLPTLRESNNSRESYKYKD